MASSVAFVDFVQRRLWSHRDCPPAVMRHLRGRSQPQLRNKLSPSSFSKKSTWNTNHSWVGTAATEDACSCFGICLVLSLTEHTCIHVLHRCSTIRQTAVIRGALSHRGLLNWRVAEQACVTIKIIDLRSAHDHDHRALTATFSTLRRPWSGWSPRLVLRVTI